MSVRTQFIAAEEDEIEAVGESLNPIDEWSGPQMREVDTARIALLHCLSPLREIDKWVRDGVIGARS